MNIPRTDANLIQLGLQSQRMQTTSPRTNVQTSPFDANASAYREDMGSTDLGSDVGRRGFLIAGLATLVGAGCSKKGKTQEVKTKPGKDPKAVAHDRKTPITLPPDGVGDVDGIEVWRRTQKPSTSSKFPWGKVALYGGLGTVGAILLTVGTLALLRRRKRFNAITGDELQYVMKPLEWHDTGTRVQVKLAEPKENGDLDDFVDGTEAKLIRKLAEERKKDSGFRLFKRSTWGKGPKEFNFKMSDALAAIEVTNEREVKAVRDVLEESGIKRGWFVRNEAAGDDMYTFNLTRYKRPWRTKKAIAEGKAAVEKPASGELPETVGATEGADSGNQPDVKIDRHALAKVAGEGYYIHAEGQAAHLYAQEWQARVIDAITGVDNGKSLQFLTENCAKQADKSITRDQVRQLLRDIGSMGVLAPNSEIHDEYLIVAPVVSRERAEAKLGNDQGITMFRPSAAAASQDQGQSSPGQDTMATAPEDADAQADSAKKPPYYKGEPGKIAEIVLKDSILNVPYAFRSALSLCAGTGGCSLNELKDTYGALDEKQFAAFYKFLDDHGLAALEVPMNADAPITFLIPSMDKAPVLTTEDATRAGVKPASLDSVAGDVDSEVGFTDAMMAKAAAGKAAPMGPPPRGQKSAPTSDSGPAPKVADETGPTDYVKPDDILGVPAATTSNTLGDKLKLDFPGDSATNMPPIQFEFTGLDAAILRASMDKSLNSRDTARIVQLGLAPDEAAVRAEAQELAGDHYLVVNGDDVRVDPYWRPYFPDVPVVPAKPTRPRAPKPPAASAAEPKAPKASPATTFVDAEETVGDEDIVEAEAADAAPAPRTRPDTEISSAEPLDDDDIVAQELDSADAAEAELAAARQELVHAEEAQDRAVKNVEAAMRNVAVAEGEFETAKTDAQTKAAATYEAETEEEEQRAADAAEEAQRIFARKRTALKRAREAQEAAQEALNEATARQRQAQAAETSAAHVLDLAQAIARDEQAARAQAEATAAEADEVEPLDMDDLEEMDPVETAKEELAAAQSALTAAHRAAEQTEQAYANAEARVQQVKAEVKGLAMKVYDVEEDEQPQIRETLAKAERDLERARAAAGKAKDADNAAEEAIAATELRLNRAQLLLKQAQAAEKAETQEKARAAAEAAAELKASVAASQQAAAESAQHARQHGRAGDTVIESGATPGRSTAQVVKDELPAILPKTRRLAPQGPRKPSETVADIGANPANTTTPKERSDASLVREDLAKAAASQREPIPAARGAGGADEVAKTQVFSRGKKAPGPMTIASSEAQQIQELIDELKQKGTVTTSAKFGMLIIRDLNAKQIPYEPDLEGDKITIRLARNE